MTDIFSGDERSRISAKLLIAHLLFLLIACIVVFSNNRALLYLGYDGSLFKQIVQYQHDWVPFGFSFANNPLQGLGDIFFPMNTRLMPVYWFSSAITGGRVIPIAAYTFVSFEIFLSALLLCSVFRFRASIALISAWASVVITMPFFYPFVFYPVTSLGPHQREAVSIQLAGIIIFYLMGRGSLARTVALGAAFFAVLFFLVAAYPATFFLCLPNLALFGFVLLIFSSNRKEMRDKALGALAVTVAALLILLPVVMGFVSYSVPAFFSSELLQNRAEPLYASIYFHKDWGPYLFILSAIGAVATGFFGSGEQKKLALACLLEASLIAWGGYFLQNGQLGKNYFGPAALYIEFFLWPFYFLFATCAVAFLLNVALIFFKKLAPRLFATPGLLPAIGESTLSFFALATPIVAIALSFENRTVEKLQFRHPAETPIIQKLEEEIAISPGSPFRGSVATFTGFAEEPGPADWSKLFSEDAHIFDFTGNGHRAVGFWEYKIPTLFEYNASISPQFYFVASRLLARPGDRQIRSVIVLSMVNAPYLQSLGVRFLVTDFPLEENLKRHGVLQFAGDERLFFYELPRPNVGNYSPTTPIVAATAAETIKVLSNQDFDFENEVVIYDSLPSGGLEKAAVKNVAVEKHGMKIEAESGGRSLLLLPLQYSRCLDLRVLKGQAADARVIRLNLAQAGLLFSGAIEAEISFAHGPFKNRWCRVEDSRDMKRLKLNDTPEN